MCCVFVFPCLSSASTIGGTANNRSHNSELQGLFIRYVKNNCFPRVDWTWALFTSWVIHCVHVSSSVDWYGYFSTLYQLQSLSRKIMDDDDSNRWKQNCLHARIFEISRVLFENVIESYLSLDKSFLSTLNNRSQQNFVFSSAHLRERWLVP
jgi:hypothetical protein